MKGCLGLLAILGAIAFLDLFVRLLLTVFPYALLGLMFIICAFIAAVSPRY